MAGTSKSLSKERGTISSDKEEEEVKLYYRDEKAELYWVHQRNCSFCSLGPITNRLRPSIVMI